jgi:hypothetical protein
MAFIAEGHSMSVFEATVAKLKVLPEDKIEAVAHYIDSLSKPTKGRFDDLAGCLTTEEADRFERAINESSERIESGHQGW